MSLAILVILLGIVVLIVGFLFILGSAIARGKGEVRGGVVLLIGPIPIIVGSDVQVTKWLIVLALVLTILTFALYFVTAGWFR
ncbi:DUF131 domain-containing protein [Infirmifilum lucidum]|uniref:DUF131 domain-containing protein n=1 Tax=Infirmifilum lucidum TaxID=2776706 RepID=A0A7L9FKU1_9CREN|nr:DUF131 domain-containing protein [Infirmifilum lucidum]QOJ79425.1 DUF131 domain-containing protein [Infirmifilum lucidum]